MTREEAQNFIDSIVLMREAAHDKDASRCVACYPVLSGGGGLVKSGTRIQWCGKLMRAAVDLWDRPENTPDKATNLWEEIQYKDGYRIIPSPITVGTAFSKGERGWWNGILYESRIDNNVWTPSDSMAQWKKVE